MCISLGLAFLQRWCIKFCFVVWSWIWVWLHLNRWYGITILVALCHNRIMVIPSWCGIHVLLLLSLAFLLGKCITFLVWHHQVCLTPSSYGCCVCRCSFLLPANTTIPRFRYAWFLVFGGCLCWQHAEQLITALGCADILYCLWYNKTSVGAYLFYFNGVGCVLAWCALF